MPVLLLFVFRFVRLLLSGHQAVAIENAALRMQIAAFQRKRKRPLLTTLDRMFWITLRSLSATGASRCSTSSQTRLCGGSASGSGDSGLGFPSRGVVVEVALAPLQNSAD